MMQNMNKTPSNDRSISVLMPIYNASKTIGPALISTYLTLPARGELLLFLDGPGTRSRWLDIIAKSKRVKLFESSERVGIAAGLNFLVGKSNSLYVARMDADDIALPFRYRKPLRRIRRNISDVVFSHSILFGARVGPCIPIPQFPIHLNHEQSKLHLLIANPFVHPTMVARKSLLVDSGGYNQCPAEDYELWLRLAASGARLERLSNYGVLYRRHESQWTADPNHDESVKSDPQILNGLKTLRVTVFASPNQQEPTLIQIEEKLVASSLGFRLRNKFLSAAIAKVKIT